MYTRVYMDTILSLFVDSKVNESSQKLASQLGISIDTVVNIYLDEFISSGIFCVGRDRSQNLVVVNKIVATVLSANGRK